MSISIGRVRPVAAVAAGVLVGGVVLVGVIVHMTNTPDRSAPSFCNAYRTEKAAYLQKTNQASGSSLNDLLVGISAVVGLPTMFDRLDKVAPNDIEPDVANIRDSLKAEEQAVADHASDPLAGLAGSLLTGLMASDSWNRVGAYVERNCATSDEKTNTQASPDMQAQALADDVTRADNELGSAIAALTSDLNQQPRIDSSDPSGTGDTSDLGDRFQRLQKDFAAMQADAKQPPQKWDCFVHDDTVPMGGGGQLSTADFSTISVDVDNLKYSAQIYVDPTTPPTSSQIRKDIEVARQAEQSFTAALASSPSTSTTNSQVAADKAITDASTLADRLDAGDKADRTKASGVISQAEGILRAAVALVPHCPAGMS